MRNKAGFVARMDVRVLTRRALALAHAAIERPTQARVKEARRVLTGVLSTLAGWPVGEAVELAQSVRRVLDALVVVEQRVAFN
jgi:hypothetical protein